MWHDSEVAAIAYAVQNILARRVSRSGAAGAAAWRSRHRGQPGLPPAMAGKKCSECGAHAVIRKDGCDYCTQCGHLGTCG
jgi:ribonucleoside-diphosphate reductase alpha chain